MDQEPKTILIVDPDEAVLSSIKRVIRHRKREWRVLTSTSGENALKLLEENPADAVISDLKLTDMEGTAFFEKVKERHPSVIRIVTASTPEEGSAIASTGKVHQYLQKPFDSEILVNILDRSFEMRRVFKGKNILEIISSTSSIPSLPQLYLELTEKLNDPDVSSKEIGKLIQKDPGMSAKILQLVNSAFFGLYGKVGDPARAVTILGTDTVKALVLTYGVFTKISPRKVSACKMEDFWLHNIYVASLSKVIGMKECLLDTICQNDIFTAGVLHDVGKLLFVDKLTDQYARLLRENKGPLVEAEINEFGCHHGEVGAYLLQLWGLPDKIVEAVLWHHGPLDMLRRAGLVPCLVWLSDQIVNAVTRNEESLEAILEKSRSCVEIKGSLLDYQEYCQRLVEGGQGEGI